MNTLVITGGAFTKEKNFSGYTPSGKRVHIFAKQMNGAGFTKDADVIFPLFVTAEERTYTASKDANGKVVPFADGSTTMTRLTAGALFTTKAKLIEAHVLEASIDGELAHHVTQATAQYSITGASVAQLEELA